MYKALWMVKKNEIYALMKKISNRYGGDEKEWFEDYFNERIAAWRNDLDTLLKCFWDLEKQL